MYSVLLVRTAHSLGVWESGSLRVGVGVVLRLRSPSRSVNPFICQFPAPDKSPVLFFPSRFDYKDLMDPDHFGLFIFHSSSRTISTKLSFPSLSSLRFLRSLRLEVDSLLYFLYFLYDTIYTYLYPT